MRKQTLRLKLTAPEFTQKELTRTTFERTPRNEEQELT